MIITALVKYYEALAKQGRIAEVGYGQAKVSFALCLHDDGRLMDIISLKQEVQRGKKSVQEPRVMRVPEPVKRTVGVASNFLCDNAGYFLGYDTKGKPGRTRECFEAAKALHVSMLKGVDSRMARAIVGFFETWDMAEAATHPLVAPYLEALAAGGNLVFMLGTDFAHEALEILAAWDAYYAGQGGGTELTCLATGQRAPVALLHPSIKGVRDAQSSGASLVSFNAAAYESFGRDQEQGLNAPVSEYAAFAYGAALNALLADERHRQVIGDTTVVFWSEDANVKPQDVMATILGTGNDADVDVDAMLSGVFRNIRSAQPVDMGMDINCPFYVLGLAPNAARLSVRFFLRDSFGAFLKRLDDHYERLEIVHGPGAREYLLIPMLLYETINPNSTKKQSSPLMSGALQRDILAGHRYPFALYSGVMLRIRADRDINRARAAIIKAYLKRNSQDQDIREGLTVALNESGTHPAYVLGRLFSVLEQVQEQANPGINTTIKDRYFTSACATPASVFPTLIKLSRHHLAKLDKYRGYHEARITDIVGKLEGEPLPARLTLDEQGLFILGYYHQTQARYTKNTQKEEQTNG